MPRENQAITLEKIGADRHRVMPWKNGLGVTREIAIDPPGGDMARADFGWRLSIATVERSGPFSAFPGIERTIMLIEGAGMILRPAGQPPRRLDRLYEPYRFSGDTPTDCELLAGPIRDFNLMANRAAFESRIDLRRIAGRAAVACEAPVGIVHLLAGQAEIATGGLAEAAVAGDTLVIRNQREDRLDLEVESRAGEAVVAAISLRRRL
jgi:hypothetical protein